MTIVVQVYYNLAACKDSLNTILSFLKYMCELKTMKSILENLSYILSAIRFTSYKVINNFIVLSHLSFLNPDFCNIIPDFRSLIDYWCLLLRYK